MRPSNRRIDHYRNKTQRAGYAETYAEKVARQSAGMVGGYAASAARNTLTERTARHITDSLLTSLFSATYSVGVASVTLPFMTEPVPGPRLMFPLVRACALELVRVSGVDPGWQDNPQTEGEPLSWSARYGGLLFPSSAPDQKVLMPGPWSGRFVCGTMLDSFFGPGTTYWPGEAVSPVNVPRPRGMVIFTVRNPNGYQYHRIGVIDAVSGSFVAAGYASNASNPVSISVALAGAAVGLYAWSHLSYNTGTSRPWYTGVRAPHSVFELT